MMRKSQSGKYKQSDMSPESIDITFIEFAVTFYIHPQYGSHTFIHSFPEWSFVYSIFLSQSYDLAVFISYDLRMNHEHALKNAWVHMRIVSQKINYN